jgi:ribonuclease HI
MPRFECQICKKAFEVPQESLDRYPGWTPKACRACKGKAPQVGGAVRKASRPGAAATALRKGNGSSREENLTPEEVLAKYTEGPLDGVFTDGAAHPNPGPGGWGAVYVRDGEVVREAQGHDPDTTNNRMELTALIEGCQLVPTGERAVVWTDSELCVNTITKWAAGWKKNGWKRKTGPIKNLDLVQTLFQLCEARPELELRWIRAHSGNRWNEYADALATAYRRQRK